MKSEPIDHPAVLHVITTIARGGAENHLYELVQGQLAAGWSVSVAFLRDVGERYWREPFEAMGVNVFDLTLSHYGEISPILKLRKIINFRKYNIIHAHLPPAELYTRLSLIGKKSYKLIISKHNDKEFAHNWASAVLEHWCAKRAAKVIAISGAVESFFAKRWPRDLSRRIVKVHYGIDPDPYVTVTLKDIEKVRAAWGAVADTIVIGSVARLTKQKALDVMLKGFAAAVAKAPEGRLKLALVGQGELEAELKKLAKKLGVTDRVVFAGFRSDIPAVMRSFDLFVLTSDFEGFGLVLLEAMSASKPILATSVSAIPEVVTDGVTGILVPKQDPDAFARGVLHFLNSDLRARMGQAGFQRVREEFQLSVMVRRTLQVYEQVLA
jgi:glycosyltransferase involved in cell wall biosynthesis